MKIIENIRNECIAHITFSQDRIKRFFKSSEGSYGYHDEFLGVAVPDLRNIAKKYKNIDLSIIDILIKSKYNEERLLALFLLIDHYKKSDLYYQKKIFQFYIDNINYVNNWNLVDASAHYILGNYLWDKDKSILIELAESTRLWNKRISIVATLFFIRKSELEWTFKIAKLLQNDSHDLIHKAVGWMLREAGKKNEEKLILFLFENGKIMPKTMIRYATEKISHEKKALIKSVIIS